MRGQRLAFLAAFSLLLAVTAAIALFPKPTVAPGAAPGDLVSGGSAPGLDLRTLPQTGSGPTKPTREREEGEEGPAVTKTVPAVTQDAPVGAGAAPEGPLAPAPAASPNYDGLHFGETCGTVQCGQGHPPDTNGDVGPVYYLQTINTALGIYNKNTGVRVVGISFDDLMSQGDFGNLCDTDNFGDPIVLWDSFHDRWIVTDFAFQLDSSNNVVDPPGAFQCFAVSMSGNPVSGGWNFYSLAVPDALQDYPKFGIWPDGLYMSANMFDFSAGGPFLGARVWALNLAQMEAGAPSVQSKSFDVPTVPDATIGDNVAFAVLPSNARVQTGTPPNGTPNYFTGLVQSDTAVYTDRVRVWKFHVDWNNTNNSTFTGPFDSMTGSTWGLPPADVPSKGGNDNDTLGFRLMMQNQYSNINGVESLWNSHTVRGATAPQSAVRWYQLPVTGGTVGAALQAATWNPTTASRYIPSVAVDRLGDMAIGYTTSSSTVPAGLRYAGRLAGDTANTLPLTEMTMIAGTGSQTGNCGPSACHRWGDYSAMTLDPDGCRFWYTNEYYVANGLDHHTRIGAFKYAGCTPLPVPTPTPTVTPTGGATPTPTASPTPTPTKSPSPTPSPTPTPTASPSPTPTATATATASPTATPTQPPQDTTPPTVGAPVTVVALNVQLQTTSASVPLRISWSGTDASGIGSFVLQQSKDGAAFTNITLNSPTDTVITVFKTPAHTYAFRVQATDTKGNTSAFVTGPTMTLAARQETSASISYVGTWTLGSPAGAFGGSVKYAKASTARATFSFTGRSVAWVSQMSSNRGIADVYVDGVFVQSVDLFSATTKPRMTVFTRSWATSGAHTVQIRIKATLNRPRGDVDAFAFLK